MDFSVLSRQVSPMFQSVQESVVSYPAFPSLWIPHCILMSIVSFSRAHPLSLFIMGMLYTFPGGILATLLLAQPALSFMLNAEFLGTATICWWLVFYMPGDLIVKAVETFKLSVPMSGMQDFLRIQLVYSGVVQINGMHPKAFLYPVVFGFCKSSGFLVFKFLENAIHNGFETAFIIPNVPTKTCALASILMTCQVLGYLPSGVTLEALVTIFVAWSLLLRCLSAILGDFDPYAPLENVFCALAFGRVDSEEVVGNGTVVTPMANGKQDHSAGSVDQNNSKDKKKAAKRKAKANKVD